MARQLSRRSIVAAAAWATPAVTLVVATPAYAVSDHYRVGVVLWRSVMMAGEVTGLQISVERTLGGPAAGVAVALTIDGIPAFFDQPVATTAGDGIFQTFLRVRTACDPGTGIVTASVGADHATATCEVVHDAVIVHAAGGSSTRVIALPHGSQGNIEILENRGMQHSDLQPTGRWVRAGDVLTLEVAGSPSWWLEVAIGSRGPMAAFNSDGSAEPVHTVLSGGTNTVIADRDGLVFLVNHSDWSAVVVTIAGGRAQPVWVQGASARADFDQQMRDFADAPMVTHVADRVFADVQRRVLDAGDVVSVYDPQELSTRLDLIRNLTDGVYGLSYDAVGVSRKYAGRVYIAGPDSGGAYAFATTQWLSLHVSSDASAAMVKNTDLWALWHEIGHTYQTPDYTWSGLGEVTVNIFSLALQKQMTGQNMLDQSPGLQDRVRRYFAQPQEDRRFADLVGESPFYPLFLFDQLRRSFGEGFYPALSQYYRVRRSRGASRPQTDQHKIDLFARATSLVAGRDLGPFFRAWGVPVLAEALAEIGDLTPLANEIWTSLVSTDAPLERTVPYNPPTGAMSTSVVFVHLGDTVASDVRVDDIGSLGGSRSSLIERGAVALQMGPSAGRVYALLESAEGTQEVLQRTVSVTAASALEFVGFYDVMIGSIAPSADGTHLVATSLGNQAHQFSFAGRVYYEIELRDAAGTVIATASVRGEDTAAPVVAAFHGVSCRDGDVLVVTAAEPGRVRVYTDSVQTSTLSSTPQRLTISGGRFII
jgi:hypothetical protein